MNVVGYLRVSTDRQAERGLGMDVQEHAIRAWSRTTSHKVKLWCRDEGLSGSNGLETRLGLADALGALRTSEVSGVVVYRLDRLARDLVLQEQLLAEIRRLGGELFSTSGAEAAFLVDDPDDPSRKMIRQVLGAVSEYERSMIALRLRSGRRRKADVGGYAYGSPPLGYTARDRELVAVDDEQAVLATMVELRAEGASLRQICLALESRGFLTKRGLTRWHPAVVSAALARQVGQTDDRPAT